MKIAVIQPVINGECKPAIEKVTRLVQEAAENQARLVVFPEAYLTGYVLSHEQAKFVALTLESEIIQALNALSIKHTIHIVIGAITRDARSKSIMNSALCFHPDGNMDTYHKSTPLWLEVDRYCKVGSEPFLMFSIDDINFAVMICYDFTNPFGVYAASLSGADVILVPTNWPLPSLSTTADFTVRARAYESKVFVAASNKIGYEQQTLFCGSSCVVAPSGQFVAQASQFDGQKAIKPLTYKDEIIYASVHKTEKVKALGDDYTISCHDPRFDLLLPLIKDKVNSNLTSHAVSKEDE